MQKVHGKEQRCYFLKSSWTLACLLSTVWVGCISAAPIDTSTLHNEIYLSKQRLNKNPNDADAWASLGALYLKTNAYKAALSALEKAKTINPSSQAWRGPLAEYYLAAQQYEQLASPTLGDSAQVRIMQGFGLIGQKQVTKARGVFEQLLQESPQSANVWAGLIKTYLVEGSIAHARQCLDKAQAQPLLPNVRLMLVEAEVHEEEGSLEQAVRVYQRALEEEPQSPYVMKGLLRVVYQQGDKLALQSYAQKFYQILPSHPEAIYYYALACIENNQLEKGVTLLSTLVKRLPNFDGAKLALGRLEFGAGRLDKARDMMGSMDSLTPSAKIVYAGVALKLGELEKAENLLQTLGNKELDSRSYGLLAALSLNKNDRDKTLTRLDKALEAIQDKEMWFKMLGLESVQDGAPSEVLVTQMNASYAQSQSFIPFDMLLVKLAMKEKQWSNAQILAQQLVQNRPEEPLAYYLLGQVYNLSGKKQAALEQFEKAITLDSNFSSAKQAQLNGYIATKQYDNAEALADKLVSANPNYLEGQLAKAEIAQVQGKLELAKEIRFKAMQNAKSSVKPQVAYLEHLLKYESLDAAHGFLDQLTGAVHQSIVAREIKGRQAYRAGQYAQAIEQLTPVVRHDSSQDLKLQLATSLLKEKDLKRASVWIKRLEADKDAKVPLGLLKATMALQNQSYDQVIQELNKISEYDPENPDIFRLKAQAQRGLGLDAQASLNFEQSFNRHPTHEVCLEYIQALKDSGQMDLASKVVGRWLEEHPHDQDLRQEAIGLAKERGQVIEEILQYEAMLKNKPNDLGVLTHLIDLNTKVNREKSLMYARQAYALQASPEFADKLGWALLMNEKRSESLNLIQEALTKLPESPIVHYHYAVIQKRLGELDKAKQHLTIALSDKNFPQRQQAQALLEAIELGYISQ